MNPGTPRAAMLALTATCALALLTGCASNRRTVSFTTDTAPAASASSITIQVARVERAPGSLILRLYITNPTPDAVDFARRYSAFTSMSIIHGSERITGVRTPFQSRTSSPSRYLVLAGEHADLSLDFRAADIDRATDLALTVRGSTHGTDQTWTITIPPEPLLPAAITP
jgi:hypothetical protein